jgi:hypothetical protein
MAAARAPLSHYFLSPFSLLSPRYYARQADAAFSFHAQLLLYDFRRH